MLAVCKNHNNRTCIAFDATKDRVRFIISEEGVTEVRQLSTKEFDREFIEIEGYPVLRAARLYLNPLTTAIEVTAEARAALTRIIHNQTEETSAMATIEASTTQGQQNVNATIEAGLKTGTKGKPAPKGKRLPSAAKESKVASAPEKPVAKPTKTESAMTTKTTKNAKATKTTAKAAPAKKAAKPATKNGAAKLVKGKAAKAPAKKAAAKGKRNTSGLTPFASKADQKIKQHPEANVRGGAMKELFDFVGKKGCTRAEAVAHMAKKDKEEGAEQRARNNISWGLRHDVFVEA